MVKKFELDKGYEEVEIADKTYRIDLSDEKRKMYQQKSREMQKESEKLNNMGDDISEEEASVLIDEVKEVTRDLSDLLLGEGAFEEIYEKANESVIIVVDVIFDVVNYINELDNEKFEAKKEKYIKHKKK